MCVCVCVEGAVHVGAGLGEPIFASHIIVRIQDDFALIIAPRLCS